MFLKNNINFMNYEINQLPKGFIYLHEVIPSAIINMKYYTADNFINKKVAGYKSNVAILTIEAAYALQQVAEHMQKLGYSLVIYDAYRPMKAVAEFVSWANDHFEISRKNEFYPNIDKSKVIELGYISSRSAHSRGSTVDLSIIKSDENIQDTKIIKQKFGNLEIDYRDDNTVNMGTSFDFLDELSHHGNMNINSEMRNYRELLKDTMLKHGFNSYTKEWWHYTLNNEPYIDKYFDFDVK